MIRCIKKISIVTQAGAESFSINQDVNGLMIANIEDEGNKFCCNDECDCLVVEISKNTPYIVEYYLLDDE